MLDIHVIGNRITLQHPKDCPSPIPSSTSQQKNLLIFAFGIAFSRKMLHNKGSKNEDKKSRANNAFFDFLQKRRSQWQR